MISLILAWHSSHEDLLYLVPLGQGIPEFSYSFWGQPTLRRSKVQVL